METEFTLNKTASIRVNNVVESLISQSLEIQPVHKKHEIINNEFIGLRTLSSVVCNIEITLISIYDHQDISASTISLMDPKLQSLILNYIEPNSKLLNIVFVNGQNEEGSKLIDEFNMIELLKLLLSVDIMDARYIATNFIC